MKMYCDTNKLPALPFGGPHPKPHGARGLSKNYHLNFDPNLGHGICAIRRIPCACVACISMLDQPWISGVHSTNRHATNLSVIVLIGHFWDHTQIGISLI